MTSESPDRDTYADLFFGADVAAIDPRVNTLIQLEEERQKRRIILIPSESYAPLAVRQALGSVFTNIYAEGYPPSQMMGLDEELLSDLAQQLTYYRRYADRRFYKGADYVHLIETLAQRRAAACFANERVRAQDIWVNVQPLSGAAANLAVYDALMEPGDTLMGMDLFQGGHLTHGSEFNVSGKRYRVVSYGVSKADARLDYDEIQRLALDASPAVIVAGYTSYPWAPDFDRFRAIADSVGAYLVADIAHPAGMVIAGQYPSPVGIADVVTFTTHKTLCGPRGACILTTDPELARKIDRAVFPGMQGGPHTNKFAAMCVAFEIARTAAFSDLQRRTVGNAQALAKGLVDRGLELAYGGTDTHLFLLDLKSVQSGCSPSAQERPLYGEVVARILDLAGIVVNKNTIPGDTVTALATGIRMGTTWVTQRGMGPEEMDRLAGSIARIAKDIVPFYYEGISRRLPRGKIDLDTLEEVKWEIHEMACAAEVELEHEQSAYPHYCIFPQEIELPAPLFAASQPWDSGILAGGAALVDLSDLGVVQVSGGRGRPFLNDVCTADIAALEPGLGTRSFLLNKEGQVLDDVTVWQLPGDKRRREQYLVLTSPENTDQVVSWLRALSDGYVLFDDQDVWRKVQGPAEVEVLSDPEREEQWVAIALYGTQAGTVLGTVLDAELPKPAASQPLFACAPARYDGCSLWIAHQGYVTADAHYVIAGPRSCLQALWSALSGAGAVSLAAPQARYHLRELAALPASWPVNHGHAKQRQPLDGARFIESLPRLFSMSKPYFVGQNRLPQPDVDVDKRAFAWEEPADAALKHTPLYEEHQKLGAKMVPFAGWEMPVWYTSVGEEHQAVREAAGLFDVAHMGTLEIRGPHAADFLDLVSVNYARWIKDGESQYAALLNPAGHILDDLIIYRLAWDRFFMVVNASNFGKDWAWLNAVNDNEVIIDQQRPWVDVLHPVTLHDLKDPASGPDQRVDVALQGPASLDILVACADSPALRARLVRLERTKLIAGTLGGIDLLIARTGYTGEEVGYELYVHPDQAPALWRMLLDRGAAWGIKPCGLAARDSTRIEAGLPLYGHDLAGPLDISQNEAGFAGYVKYHKPFFIGRDPYKAYNDQSTRRIVRFQVTERGARALRGGEHPEPVVNTRGRVIGAVTSCTLVGDRQIGMALVDERYTEPETELLIYPLSQKGEARPPQALQLGDSVALPVRAVVLSRFPGRDGE
jgi:glycine cleavage system T protein